MVKRKKHYKYDPSNKYGAFGSGPAKTTKKSISQAQAFRNRAAATVVIMSVGVLMLGYASLQYFSSQMDMRDFPSEFSEETDVPVANSQEEISEANPDQPTSNTEMVDPSLPDAEPVESIEEVPAQPEGNKAASSELLVEEEMTWREEADALQAAQQPIEDNQEEMTIGGDE